MTLQEEQRNMNEERNKERKKLETTKARMRPAIAKLNEFTKYTLLTIIVNFIIVLFLLFIIFLILSFIICFFIG